MLIAVFLVMLGLIWFNEGWQKALKLFGLFVASLFILVIIEKLCGIKIGSEFSRLLTMLFWGAWSLGLTMYCLWQGYFTNPNIPL